jgi:hypothetical protein
MGVVGNNAMTTPQFIANQVNVTHFSHCDKISEHVGGVINDL